MKNIHILPTDKPSRLAILHNNKLHIGTSFKKDFNVSPQHIYITNDEEIKEGWSYDRMMKSIGKRDNVYSSKIVLTTDQDLINDGVQAIDDTFLEWFVKNPSCEEVEVTSEIKAYDDQNRELDYAMEKGDYTKLTYKIIIPKYTTSNLDNEKYKDFSVAKQRTTNYMSLKGALEPKQETLDEAGAVAAGLCEHLEAKEQAMFIAGFQECLKWQQERMYSEEDMRKCWNSAYIDALSLDEETYKPLFFEDFIEEFKKR